MSALKDLKKRLTAVNSTRQLTSAMKTVSSIKFSRINNIASGYKSYAEGCSELVNCIGFTENKATENPKKLFVLISGNRGLCGGYNIELFDYFGKIVKSEQNALYMACGKKAIEYCKTKNIPLLDTFLLPDIPDFTVAANLSDKLKGYYENGTVNNITFVCQKHINLLKREPQSVLFLGGKNQRPGRIDDTIYIPDKETVTNLLYPFYLNNTVYSVLLNCAAGVQGATLTAMRSAYDTANESAQALETSINRRRQADVTASVIETSSDFNDRNEV